MATRMSGCEAGDDGKGVECSSGMRVCAPWTFYRLLFGKASIIKRLFIRGWDDGQPGLPSRCCLPVTYEKAGGENGQVREFHVLGIVSVQYLQMGKQDGEGVRMYERYLRECA